MHTSWLSQPAPAIAALAFLTASYIGVWMIYFERRPLWDLLRVGSHLLWCIFFSLLYITAGPNPILERARLVYALRDSEFTAGMLLLAWGVWTVHTFSTTAWTVKRARSK